MMRKRLESIFSCMIFLLQPSYRCVEQIRGVLEMTLSNQIMIFMRRKIYIEMYSDIYCYCHKIYVLYVGRTIQVQSPLTMSDLVIRSNIFVRRKNLMRRWNVIRCFKEKIFSDILSLNASYLDIASSNIYGLSQECSV